MASRPLCKRTLDHGSRSSPLSLCDGRARASCHKMRQEHFTRLHRGKMRRIFYIDGLRGIFAVTVMLSHIWGGVTGWPAIRPFSGAYLSVDYFFILSGYVLTHLFAHRYFTTLEFTLLRFLRLWPLHLVVVVMALIIFSHNRSVGLYAPNITWNDWGTIALNLAFFMNLGFATIPVINPPSWSIGIEFWVSSLLLPIFARISPRVTLLLSLGLYAFIFATVGHWQIPRPHSSPS